MWIFGSPFPLDWTGECHAAQKGRYHRAAYCEVSLQPLSHYLGLQSLILNISADDLCSRVALWPQNPPHPYSTCHCATACVLTENQAIRVKWQFSTHLENKKRIQSIQRQNRQTPMICRAGVQGLSAPLTRELKHSHRWPQHLLLAGMKSLVFTCATQSDVERQQMMKCFRWVQMGGIGPVLSRGHRVPLLWLGSIWCIRIHQEYQRLERVSVWA